MPARLSLRCPPKHPCLTMHAKPTKLPSPHQGAISSAGEHCLHTAGVTGSIPVSPTILSRKINRFATHHQLESLQYGTGTESRSGLGGGTRHRGLASPHSARTVARRRRRDSLNAASGSSAKKSGRTLTPGDAFARTDDAKFQVRRRRLTVSLRTCRRLEPLQSGTPSHPRKPLSSASPSCLCVLETGRGHMVPPAHIMPCARDS